MFPKLLLAACSILAGQSTPGEGSLRGVVMNASDGRMPAAGAEVVLRVAAPQDAQARTPVNEVRALVHRLLQAIPRDIAADPSSRSSGSDPTD